MHSFNRRGLLSGIFAVIGGTALAQGTGPGPGPGPGPGGGAGMMGGRGMMGGHGMMGGPALGRMSDPAGYLENLKTRLGITAGETPAWSEYAETVTGVASQMQGVHQTMWDAMPTASWQERRDMMNTMFDARQHAFDTVHSAATKLLPLLSPAQQSQAASILPGLMQRGPGGGMGRGPMMGGRPPSN